MYKVSAPGSMMILGEHAVLTHGEALITAISARLSLTISQATDMHCEIKSAGYGRIEFLMGHEVREEKFRFVNRLVNDLCKHFKLSKGVRVAIDGFSSELGLGSSAALVAAMTAAIFTVKFQRKPQPEEILEIALSVHHSVQGTGSGADVAASLFGGVIHFNAISKTVTPLCAKLPLFWVYSGKKVPTPTVIKQVQALQKQMPEVVDPILKAIHGCVIQGQQLLAQGQFQEFGNLMAKQHHLLQSLNLSTAHIEQIVDVLSHTPGVLGVKLSGAGLGDCLVGLGSQNQVVLPSRAVYHGVKTLPYQCTEQSILIQEI